MKNRKIIAMVCAVMLYMLLPMQIFAQTLYSNVGSMPASALVNPSLVSYIYRASIRLEKGYAVGMARIDGDKPIPLSDVAAKAEIYSAAGQLLRSSGIKENVDSRLSSFYVNTTYNGSGSMYCKGTFQFLDGSRMIKRTLQTPSGVAPYSVLPEVKRNECGLLYGSNLYDERVDLVWVKGDSGVDGYAYATDLNDSEIDTIVRKIPVYDVTGKVIIDYFTIGE